jgi:hypothetical protein
MQHVHFNKEQLAAGSGTVAPLPHQTTMYLPVSALPILCPPDSVYSKE